MFSVNTNIQFAQNRNFERLNNLNLRANVEHLTSGYKVNRGADDPSGLAIASGMDAQIAGAMKSIHNAEDGISLIHFADGFLDDVQDVLLRMRDLTVRLSNEATLNAEPNVNPNVRTPSSARDIYKEILNLASHLYNSYRSFDDAMNPTKARVSFNGKEAFSGQFDFPGQNLQVGPDNEVYERMQVIINDLTPIFADLPVPYDEATSIPGNMNIEDFWMNATNLLETMDSKIDYVSNIREQLGVQENVLRNAIDDLTAEYVNVSASRSRIKDSNMAEELVNYSKNLIIENSRNAVATQANAMPLAVGQLIGAIYDGLSTGAQ